MQQPPSYTFLVPCCKSEIIIIISDLLSPTTKGKVSILSVELGQLQNYLLCHYSNPRSVISSASFSAELGARSTHNWRFEFLDVFCQPTDRIRCVSCPFHNLTRFPITSILDDGPQLITSRWIFRDIQLEFRPLGLVLKRVVPSLILCCGFGSIGGDLLEESEDADGGRDGGFVEEGYDIEGLVL